MSSMLKNPLVELAVALLVILVISALTVAAAISGALTAAAVSAAGLLSLVAIIFALKMSGK